MSKSTPQLPKIQNCFYICGLTGGPFFPIPAMIAQVKKQISNSSTILIGVQNSYESNVAKDFGYPIEFLPKVKLDILSFDRLNSLEIIIGIFKAIVSGLVLIYSISKCLFLLIKYQPILIYSTGSFLAVPMFWAAKLTNFFRFTNSKLVIHQQDAIVGLANKLTVSIADLKSCIFQYTKQKYPQFQDAHLIPNPLITSKYIQFERYEDKELEKFVNNKSQIQPNLKILLIFGGGTGSEIINTWVEQNISVLLSKFRVIHLTGLLQKNISEKKIDFGNNYFSKPAILHDMPVLLSKADLVICRAGMGSISELIFLNINTFLVPIPHTHQLQNAKLISKSNPNFTVLDQNNQSNWLDQILSQNFENPINQNFDQKSLDSYFAEFITKLKDDK